MNVLRAALVFGLSSSLLAGCAGLTVTRVTAENDQDVKGIRYFLPKPYLLVVPQADGSVAVDVIYLPDKSRAYAIDPSSQWSSYTFQVARDEKGLLNTVEFKASTTAVGQQLAQSAGAAAVQAYNMRAAQIVAVQSQVSAAQTAVDAAQAAYDAARITRDRDRDTNATPEAREASERALAQAEAKLNAAKQVLQRALSTSQAVATAAAAGSVVTTAGPAAGTVTSPAWPAPTVYSLPEGFGPVLFAINDDGKSVELKAVTAAMNGSTVVSSGLREGVEPTAQRAFDTVQTALQPPTLAPTEATVILSTGFRTAVFAFDRGITEMPQADLVTDANAATAVKGKLGDDKKTVTVDASTLQPGTYKLPVSFTYAADDRQHVLAANQTVKVIVRK